MKKKYKIFFNGNITNGKTIEEVKRVAQSTFHLSNDKINLLFNGRTHTLKEGISEDEAIRYTQLLEEIGMLAEYKSINTSTNESVKTMTKPDNMNASTPKKTNKLSPPTIMMFIILLIIIVGFIAAWQTGYITINKTLKTDTQTSASTSSSQSIETKNTDQIEACTEPKVTDLLEQILTEGLPSLIKSSSPTTTALLQEAGYNQEVYFDPERNKRLCGVIAQYKLEDETLYKDVTNPAILYEVLYEVKQDPKDAEDIELSTLKLTVLTPSTENTLPTESESTLPTETGTTE